MPTVNDPTTARRSVGVDSGQAEIDVLTLGCGQIAVALHIAGLPARWRQLPTHALIDLALTGIAKIGLDEVLRISAESHRIVAALYRSAKTPEADVSAARNQLQRIWPSDRRRQNATDAAWTIFHPTSSQASARNSGQHWAMS
jgi:hypothetical protein